MQTYEGPCALGGLGGLPEWGRARPASLEQQYRRVFPLHEVGCRLLAMQHRLVDDESDAPFGLAGV